MTLETGRVGIHREPVTVARGGGRIALHVAAHALVGQIISARNRILLRGGEASMCTGQGIGGTINVVRAGPRENADRTHQQIVLWRMMGRAAGCADGGAAIIMALSA